LLQHGWIFCALPDRGRRILVVQRRSSMFPNYRWYICSLHSLQHTDSCIMLASLPATYRQLQYVGFTPCNIQTAALQVFITCSVYLELRKMPAYPAPCFRWTYYPVRLSGPQVQVVVYSPEAQCTLHIHHLGTVCNWWCTWQQFQLLDI
jgi:hypothetical protein